MVKIIYKRKSYDDCRHIAAAILAGCDFIISWNFKHIVNFFDRALQYTQLTMEDPKNAHVLSELLISKEVLEDYCGEHNFACTEEQINGYYQAYQYLL